MNYLLLGFSITLATWSMPAYGLIQNYLEARKIGLPILITPISLLGPIWSFTRNFVKPILESLPFGLGNFVHYSGFTWFQSDRYYLHEKYGPAFLIVSPSEIQVIIADGGAADDILSRRKEFIKADAMYKPVELFGPNVDTVNGEVWQRHRRITTPPFNERNSSHVWRESLSQAGSMLSSWMLVGKSGVNKTPKDTMTLALHVLTSAGFGKSYAFDGGVTKLTDGYTMVYRDALRIVLQNLFTSIVITSVSLPDFLLPKKIKEIKVAIAEFKKYMVDMVEEERSQIQKVDIEKDNLLSVLVRISEQEGGAKGRNGLSNDEIFGNLFIYNLAGHDTTAASIAYAVMLMASDIHWQEWIREELETVFSDQEDVMDWEYEKAFPKLTRCLALLYETLRLYGPVPGFARYTGASSAIVKIRGKEYTLPPKTYIPINSSALHTLPEYWGADSLVWRPDRWIVNKSDPDLSTEELYQPPVGVFLPWAGGPRVCPGKKFAQVEFIAVIARLFRRHQVKPLLEPGETVQDAKKRVLETVEDSDVVITLQMKHPERVKLVWEEI